MALSDERETNDNDDKFANYLREKSGKNGSDSVDSCGIVAKIELFLSRPTVNYKTDIFEYWNNIKSEEPVNYTIIFCPYFSSKCRTQFF